MVRMSSTLDELKEQAAKLSHAERDELALTLIESLESPADDGDVERAWLAEVERRADQVRRGAVEIVPGDEVFARLRRQFG